MTKKYVAGFLLTIVGPPRILLVRKTKPDWQAGLLNGVGGKIEEGETAQEAMVREFKEETKGYLDVPAEDWHRFCIEYGPDYETHFFRSKYGISLPLHIPDRNDADEELLLVPLGNLPHLKVVGNLHWLVPMLRDWRNLETTVTVKDDIVTRPSW